MLVIIHRCLSKEMTMRHILTWVMTGVAALSVSGCLDDSTIAPAGDEHELDLGSVASRATPSGDVAPVAAELDTREDSSAVELTGFRQVCRSLSWGQVCATYNYDSRTAAANVQNWVLGPMPVELKLLASPGGTVLERWSGAMSKDEWKGIWRSGRNDGQYCGVANGSAICLP